MVVTQHAQASSDLSNNIQFDTLVRCHATHGRQLTPSSTKCFLVCRLTTWAALVDIYNAGGARSIGVSNYNKSQLEEIVTAGMPLPAINQIPIHIYRCVCDWLLPWASCLLACLHWRSFVGGRAADAECWSAAAPCASSSPSLHSGHLRTVVCRSSSQLETIEYCQRNGITVNAYSPLGVPDWHVFPAAGGMAATALQDPVVTAVAQVHGRTPAAVMINWLWQQGIVTNPRTVRPEHMLDNLNAYNFTLSDAEVALLSSRPQDWCSVDSKMYECAPDNIGPAVGHPF